MPSLKPPESRASGGFVTRVVRVAVAALAVLTGVFDSRCVAQGAPSGSLESGPAAVSEEIFATLNRKGDLTLRDATLEKALFTISELWGINIVAGKAEGSVNGVFKDAPLREILDTILLSNGYAYRPVGGSLVVNRLQDLGQVNPFFVSETVPVGSADVNEAVEAARVFSTPNGQVRALPSAGAVLVVDFPDRVKRMRDLILQISEASRQSGANAPPRGGAVGGRPAPPRGDEAAAVTGPRRLEVAYFRTHFITASRVAAALDVVLSVDGRTAALEEEDRLLVIDYPDHIRMVRAVISRIDRPRPQVNIRSLIYDISLSDLEEIGVNWDGISDGTIDSDGVATGRNSGVRFLTRTAAPLGASDLGSSFTFFTFEGNVDIRAIVTALQQAEDSRLLADPNVTVMDNEAATIESISEVPFQQLTQTGNGGNIGTTAFKPVGIKLDVTPKISNDRTIDLQVIPEFSRLSGFTPGDNQPIIETRRATTRLRVCNGQTIMIAGLRQRTDVGDFDGVPLLKDIRFVGHLFRSRNTQITESELVVFITPEIVGYGDPLGRRGQLTADTVNCRLDNIPAAEGCPTCYPGGGPSGCDPNGHGCQPGVVDATDVYRGAGEVVPGPTPASTPLDEPRIITPSSETPIEVLPAEDASASTSAPLPRRLPALEGAEEVAEQTPLRVDYSSRFRASGGVYPGQQRLTERPAPRPQKRESVADERRWWELWR